MKARSERLVTSHTLQFHYLPDKMARCKCSIAGKVQKKEVTFIFPRSFSFSIPHFNTEVAQDVNLIYTFPISKKNC